MFCEILFVTLNHHSTKIAPRQNIKAILRAGVCAGDLHEDTDQIGIRLFLFATDDLFLTLHLDVREVFCVELP